VKKLLVLFLLLAFPLPQAAKSVTHYKAANYDNSGVNLTLSEPTGTVFRTGESVGFTVRADRDAYFLVFDIDTQGFVHLLYPLDVGSLHKTPAGETVTIPTQNDESLLVTGKTGMEFVFAVAVPDRDAISDREIMWLLHSETETADRRLRVDGDPFLAANRVAGKLVRGIQYDDAVSLAHTYFFVDRAVDYPRYLCEDCYETDADPYDPDRPWVATTAIDRNAGLSYPLAPAFRAADTAQRTTIQTEEGTTVNVSYYPAFETERPTTSWRVAVGLGYPFYGGWGYYPYYPYYWGSGFYFSIGWNWGWWGGWDCYPYYGWGYYRPYYYSPYRYCGYYGGGYYYPVHHRGIRPYSPSKYKTKSATPLYADRAARTKTRLATHNPRSYNSKSTTTRYTPRSKYTGNTSYGSYKSKARSVYTPRTKAYGTKAYGKSSYKGTNAKQGSVYRPRSKTSYGRGYSRGYASRSGKVYTPRTSTRSRSSYKGTSRLRGYPSFNPKSYRSYRGRTTMPKFGSGRSSMPKFGSGRTGTPKFRSSRPSMPRSGGVSRGKSGGSRGKSR
jgi:hypothetical protein